MNVLLETILFCFLWSSQTFGLVHPSNSRPLHLAFRVTRQANYALRDKPGEDDIDERTEESNDVVPRKQNVAKSEEEADREVMNRLLFFDRFRSMGYVLGVGIIVVGYIFRMFGYDYVVDEKGLRIDTKEARQFQDEIVRDKRFR
mmetsp:Transcript_22053/g.28544  ORF Transcript_22053/g.28544 Transcript_22053/m.28544 type:complete len:145 (+) Transcript_22053:108-542(+)